MPARFRTPALVHFAGAALCLVLQGCATSGTTLATATPPAAKPIASSRAEQVFLYQSRVADQLLDEYPLLETFAEADPALVAAEAKMTRKCSALTQAMLTRLEGEQPSLGLRLKVLTSLDDCERAARKIERILDAGAPTDGMLLNTSI